MLATALLMMSFTLSFAKPHADYKFKVHTTPSWPSRRSRSRKMERNGASFDIGDGMEAGATGRVWFGTKSTDNGGCEWYFKAVWSDGEESDAVKFDFLRKGTITLEFTK